MNLLPFKYLRIGRLQYLALHSFWVSMIFVAALIVLLIENYIGHKVRWLVTLSGLFIGVVLILVTYVFGLKRIRDMGYRSWTLLIFLIPIINFIFLISLFLIPGSITVSVGEKKIKSDEVEINRKKYSLYHFRLRYFFFILYLTILIFFTINERG